MTESIEIGNMTEDAVEKAALAIRRGGVILYPTDTIWGLGCDMTNVSAVKRIYTIKQRPEDKPLVLLVSSIEMLKEYIMLIHPRVETLLMHHLQPLTLIYTASSKLPKHLMSPEGTIAIRVTHDEFCKKLINKTKQPLISTSANISGAEFPPSFDAIDKRILDMVDHIVDPELDHMKDAKPSVMATFNHKGELDFIRT